MYRIRPIVFKDFECLNDLAQQAQLGMTNLPKNTDRLFQYVEKSIFSFQDNVGEPAHHYYMFGLEDMSKDKLLGVSAIYSQTGIDTPLEYFAIKEIPQPPLFPEVPERIKMLERVKYTKGPSEICSLFLTHDARKEGLGKLLSLSRFLFMAAFPERFSTEVFADLRGVLNRAGHCPFWEGVGKRFLPIDFNELMHRRDLGHHEVSALMPSSPIYVNLLTPEAIAVIGETHPNTKPALQMLLGQGFIKTNEIDLYDAGPRVIAKRTVIKTIRESHIGRVGQIKNLSTLTTVLLANSRIDFRACMGKMEIDAEASLILEPETAKALELKIGDPVQYAIV